MGYLDEHTRRRIAALLLVLGAIVIGLALADVGPFSDPPTEAELAQDTVEEFFAAAADGDFDSFCGFLTKPAREAIEVRAGAIAAEQELAGCAEILKAIAGEQFKDSELEIASSSVSGDQARVETELKLEGEAGKEQRSVLLQRVRDEWLIYDPGFG